MAWKKIVLTRPLITRKHNGDFIECHGQDCDVHLKAGDTVYRKIKRHGNVYYCVSCHDKLWL